LAFESVSKAKNTNKNVNQVTYNFVIDELLKAVEANSHRTE